MAYNTQQLPRGLHSQYRLSVVHTGSVLRDPYQFKQRITSGCTRSTACGGLQLKIKSPYSVIRTVTSGWHRFLLVPDSRDCCGSDARSACCRCAVVARSIMLSVRGRLQRKGAQTQRPRRKLLGRCADHFAAVAASRYNDAIRGNCFTAASTSLPTGSHAHRNHPYAPKIAMRCFPNGRHMARSR